MNRTRYIIRGFILILIVFLIVNLYRKTESNISRIARFKFDMLDKVKTDSLDTEHKLELLVDETTRFNKQLNDDSPQIREGLRYLMGAVGLLIAVELWFYISKRRGAGE